MSNGEIESAISCPLPERCRAAHEIAGLAAKRSTTVAADHVRHHAGVDCQFDCLSKIACGDFNLMPSRSKFRNQCVKERDVRRIGEIDPDSHRLNQPQMNTDSPRFFPVLSVFIFVNLWRISACNLGATSFDQLAATTGLRSVPSFSIFTSKTSPGLSNTGGSRKMPTPSGVPLAITSPGCSVIP